MKIELTGIPKPNEESDEFKRRQQNIDLLLVLAKICEPNTVVDSSVQRKANDKISSLLDKL